MIFSIQMKMVKKPTNSSESAFTLIEIIMVLLVLGMMYAALPSLDFISTDVRAKLGTLQSDFRSAYDMAVINNKPYRLVFRFATGDYWLEETSSPKIFLSDDSIARDITDSSMEESPENFDESFGRYIDINGTERISAESTEERPIETPLIASKENLKQVRAPKWTMVQNSEWGKRSLGPDLLIKGLKAEHHNTYQSLADLGEEAQAAIYFLPRGYIERVCMHIAYNNGNNEVDEKQKPYTLLIEDPYAGVASIENDEQEECLSKLAAKTK